MSAPEVWLRGPVEGISGALQPCAHAFVQVVEDVERLVSPLTTEDLWRELGGAASVGFHCRHLVGSTGRLLTYARGEALSDRQLVEFKAERLPGDPPATSTELVVSVRRAMTDAMAQLRRTGPDQLLERREVGRARLPSTVGGLLFHAAEHATRHAGQIATTAKILRGLREDG